MSMTAEEQNKLEADRIHLIRCLSKVSYASDLTIAVTDAAKSLHYIVKHDDKQHLVSLAQEGGKESIGKVSYAPTFDARYDAKRRVRTTLARYMNRQTDIKLESKDLEAFSAALYKLIVGDGLANVVSGDDIVVAYRNAVGESSCMTGCCSEYVQVYADNPDRVELLLWNGDTREAAARALIWTEEDGSKHIDRIYPSGCTHDYAILKWAAGKGYSSLYHRHTCIKRSEEIKLELKVECEYFPYFDSLVNGKFSWKDCAEKLTLSNEYWAGCMVFERTDGCRPDSDRCSCCEGHYLADDMHTVCDDYYCAECYHDRFAECERCGESTDREDIRSVEEGGNSEEWCGCCADNYATSCDDCGVTVSADSTEDGRCLSCAEEEEARREKEAEAEAEEEARQMQEEEEADEAAETEAEEQEQKLLAESVG